jgi:cyclic beta-1,2-glucan synthetase
LPISKRVSRLLHNIPLILRSNHLPWDPSDEEPPLRSELFSADQMEQYGKTLAAQHSVATGDTPDRLLARLADNETALVGICTRLTDAVELKNRITPAGEWLLDNFYLIEEQIRTAKKHLPKGYSRELPRLATGPSAGLPRVYDIALEVVAHGDGRIDTDGLTRFVAAYQTVTNLQLGELWAIPIMLRLAAIENLRRVGMRIAVSWSRRNLANSWADQMTQTAEQDPKSLILVIADMARSNPPMVSAFVAELSRRLQGHGAALALPLTWIEQRLFESGQTIEQLIQSENQQQAGDQVSISNSIGSLRALVAMDWREFVETLSIVEQTLREDPDGIYGRMDFATRDQYRHAVERIARKSHQTESEVARKVVELANHHAPAAPGCTTDRTGHVGFYLIDKGEKILAQQARLNLSGLDVLKTTARRYAVSIYLGSITILTALVAGVLTFQSGIVHFSTWAIALFATLVLFVASQLAVTLTNWLATLLVAPRLLPKMDYSRGIPSESRTLVAVPCMLTTPGGVEALIEGLEVRYLANRDAYLHFCLLSDYLDAPGQSMPEDAALLAQVSNGIEELNNKYGGGTEEIRGDVFFLFHRDRQWNAQENSWMGYERKRGKLAALNALLRSREEVDSAHGFAHIVGDTTALTNVKFVITLDTDTQLPRNAARQFAGTLAHPLNRPVYDEKLRRIVNGYGILQPRIAISLPGTNRSHYVRLYGADSGIDPYTRAVSDVYQDLFDEGSFIGKGIYDVDAFERTLANRFPENKILSHDLLEGCYARAGLLSEVQLYEDHPASYYADVCRRHRWIRGDWQLIAWLRRCVPDNAPVNPLKCTQVSPLSFLSQWKLFDNLRRSFVPAALCMLFLLGWAVLPQARLWTLWVIGTMLAPALCAITFDLFHVPKEVLLRQHLQGIVKALGRRLVILVFELACLPHEAYFSLDAIVRTLWRSWVSHRKLLEWNPSSEVERTASMYAANRLTASFRWMAVCPILAVATLICLLVTIPGKLWLAAPILLLWLIAPVITWWVSRPLAAEAQSRLSQPEIVFLRSIARRTWAFFDECVIAAQNWLPPDNHQEDRDETLAPRTSPTNMGLALLANLAAHDFGYITGRQLIERTTQTLGTMAELARFRGHFFNWYDTQTRQPLLPLYVSTVDSGNLAGHLLTLCPGISAIADTPILPTQWLDGLRDTYRLCAEDQESQNITADPAFTFSLYLTQALSGPPSTMQNAFTCSQNLLGGAEALAAATQAGKWEQALARQAREVNDALMYFAPWLGLAPAPEGLQEAARQAFECPIMTPRELAGLADRLCPQISTYGSAQIDSLQHEWLTKLIQQITLGSLRASRQIEEIGVLQQHASELAQFDYDFLYDKVRHLLSIGYNAAEHRADPGYYDLLASEARLGYFVAIAQEKLPQESWFALGRQLASTHGTPTLLSWSGSMFEYLMPLLVMPMYAKTLLDQTCRAAVSRQIEYGRLRGVAWGISESGYNAMDLQRNFQYHAFGVPGLGLKRGLAEDLVIAPYASVLALMVAPAAACTNLQRLASEHAVGQFGFFEAIDYTPVRQRRGQTSTLIKSFMAHHQGMSLLALAYALLDKPMQRRFGVNRRFQATLLLLQERIPKENSARLQLNPHVDTTSASSPQVPNRTFTQVETLTPEVQLLSNGRYHVMITNAGGGYSRWKDLAITRWREDGTCDTRGLFCYIRDVASNTIWSNTWQPTRKRPDSYSVIFSEGRAEFHRSDAVGENDSIETYTEIVVSPEDDIELRRVRIANRSSHPREIEVTGYTEIVIAPAPEDATHPAFSNLFVQTEILAERHAILCTRRPRSVGQKMPWAVNLMLVHGAHSKTFSCETNRLNFIGRGRDVSAPLAMSQGGELSGCDGSVLDPIAAIRRLIVLEPQQSVTIDMVLGAAENREGALLLVDKYQDRHLGDRVFDLAWTHSQVVLRQLNASEADAQIYARLAGFVIHANSYLRADSTILVKNQRGQYGLWGYAISGDLPIVLLQISDSANIDLAQQLIQAHAYWRLKGLAVDLVIWNEDHAGYRQRLQEQLTRLIASGIYASAMDNPGGIFVRTADQISNEDRILFQSVARIVINDQQGTLAEQAEHHSLAETPPSRFIASRPPRAEPSPSFTGKPHKLILGNNLGGFNAEGSEYIVTLPPGVTTPAPWINVLANPLFGSIVSERGSAYTWGENAHEFRLSPWHNDPVSDPSGEAIYLRDEETGQFWSPTPYPAGQDLSYCVRHGFGYSVFETVCNDIHSELTIFVALDASVKFSVLKLHNSSAKPRHLSATGYVEWVLGELREKTAMHVVTEIDPRSGALYARNHYSADFSNRVAYFDVDDPARSLCGDRLEFIGRNGSLQQPAAMLRTRLSGKVGAGMDPCAVIQVSVDLAAGETREIVFRLGQSHDVDTAAALVQRFRGLAAVHRALLSVRGHWQETLGAVKVETPDPALNVLVNGWLLYQTLACRIWARSGYYQSGGAFGFRDQLQDMMALVHTRPDLLREHLLYSASRQFREGDVQHWWHPPLGHGVRTRCSDDYLWLPLAVCRYIACTGDQSILDEPVHFLEGRSVNPEDDSYYDRPTRSADASNLYQHCVLAVRHGLRFGEHGLPLMGSGDWNDGMNRVGIHGKGESVWLGFFLYAVLDQFGTLARTHGDSDFADICESERSTLRENLETHAWDGAWYQRAWFDDGTSLGSAGNAECQIDSLSQSWAVLSGAGDTERTQTAMDAVYARLVHPEQGLVQLLDPPFDTSAQDPGYIQGYAPGVRENGGQYTHAAIWVAMAFAEMGDSQRAWEILNLLNPVNHSRNAQANSRYKVEPYVMSADVYAVPPHTGRGGWSWYTGSAGWMYRLITESLLGLNRVENSLRMTPCLPADWKTYKVHYRFGKTIYHIEVFQTGKENVNDTIRVTVDGVVQESDMIPLIDDRVDHMVEVHLHTI